MILMIFGVIGSVTDALKSYPCCVQIDPDCIRDLPGGPIPRETGGASGVVVGGLTVYSQNNNKKQWCPKIGIQTQWPETLKIRPPWKLKVILAEKKPTSYRKSKNILVNLGLGSGGGLGTIFTVNIIRRFHKKVCWIILCFELVPVRSHYGKYRKPIVFMVFGLGGRAHDSQNQLCFIFGGTKILWGSKKKRNLVWRIIMFESTEFRKSKIENVGKDKARTPKTRLIPFWKSWI